MNILLIQWRNTSMSAKSYTRPTASRMIGSDLHLMSRIIERNVLYTCFTYLLIYLLMQRHVKTSQTVGL